MMASLSDLTNTGMDLNWRRVQPTWPWPPWVQPMRETIPVQQSTHLDLEKRIHSSWRSQVSHFQQPLLTINCSPAKVLDASTWEDNSCFGRGADLPVPGELLAVTFPRSSVLLSVASPGWLAKRSWLETVTCTQLKRWQWNSQRINSALLSLLLPSMKQQTTSRSFLFLAGRHR